MEKIRQESFLFFPENIRSTVLTILELALVRESKARLVASKGSPGTQKT